MPYQFSPRVNFEILEENSKIGLLRLLVESMEDGMHNPGSSVLAVQGNLKGVVIGLVPRYSKDRKN